MGRKWMQGCKIKCHTGQLEVSLSGTHPLNPMLGRVTDFHITQFHRDLLDILACAQHWARPWWIIEAIWSSRLFGEKIAFLCPDSGFYVSAGWISLVGKISMGMANQNADVRLKNNIISWFFLVIKHIWLDISNLELSPVFQLFRK